MTRGTGIMHQRFYDYEPYQGELSGRGCGVMSSHTAGHAVAYALWALQDRGEIFVHPGDPLYAGMIVGVNNKGHDLVVNATREKKLTNIRTTAADEAIYLVPPREMTLEFALQFIEDDELVEVTPKHVRMRKKLLSEHARKKAARAANPV
jgi:GTP-binding protein